MILFHRQPPHYHVFSVDDNDKFLNFFVDKVRAISSRTLPVTNPSNPGLPGSPTVLDSLHSISLEGLIELIRKTN